MLMPSLALGAPIRSPNAHYEPPKFIMNISFIMNLIMRFLVFQWGILCGSGEKKLQLALKTTISSAHGATGSHPGPSTAA